MAVLNLTEARIRELPMGSGIHRDEQVKGLMVICHASTKTYADQGDVRRNGRHIRTVREKIARCDRIGLREHRNRGQRSAKCRVGQERVMTGGSRRWMV